MDEEAARLIFPGCYVDDAGARRSEVERERERREWLRGGLQNMNPLSGRARLGSWVDVAAMLEGEK